PGADVHLASFDQHRRARIDWLELLLGAPRDWLLALITLLVEMLLEVALSMQQRHTNHRDRKISGGAERVAGEHPQAAAIGRDGLVERDLHGEIRDHAIGQNRTHQASPAVGVGELVASPGRAVAATKTATNRRNGISLSVS